MSHPKKYRMKRWRVRLYNRKCRHWKNKLEKIECEYLRTKVACIAFWDSLSYTGLEVNPEPRTYLKNLADKWRPFFEDFYTEDEVMCELIKLEYPVKGQGGAYSRSRKPNRHHGGCK